MAFKHGQLMIQVMLKTISLWGSYRPPPLSLFPKPQTNFSQFLWLNPPNIHSAARSSPLRIIQQMSERTFVVIFVFWAFLTIITPTLVLLSETSKPALDLNGKTLCCKVKAMQRESSLPTPYNLFLFVLLMKIDSFCFKFGSWEEGWRSQAQKNDGIYRETSNNNTKTYRGTYAFTISGSKTYTKSGFEE